MAERCGDRMTVKLIFVNYPSLGEGIAVETMFDVLLLFHVDRSVYSHFPVIREYILHIAPAQLWHNGPSKTMIFQTFQNEPRKQNRSRLV